MPDRYFKFSLSEGKSSPISALPSMDKEPNSSWKKRQGYTINFLRLNSHISLKMDNKERFPTFFFQFYRL